MGELQEINLTGDDFRLDDILTENENDISSNYNNYLRKPKQQTLNSEAKQLIKTTHNRLSDEEIEKKQKLIITISRYRESPRFKSYLDGLGFSLSASTLKQKDIVELEDLLKELQVAVMNKNSSQLLNEVYYLGTGIAEGITQNPKIKPKCDLTGFSKIVKEDEQIQDTLEVLNLSYGDIASLSPEKKIILLTFSSALKCASVNKMLNDMKSKQLERTASVMPSNNNDTEKSLPVVPSNDTTGIALANNSISIGENEKLSFDLSSCPKPTKKTDLNFLDFDKPITQN